jgi:hypothetical protein
MFKYNEMLIVTDWYEYYKKQENKKIVWKVDLIISKTDNEINIHKNRGQFQDAVLFLNQYFDIEKININHV